MTKEEIKNTPELVDFMLDECVLADSRAKVHKRLEEVCDLATKALEQEPVLDKIRAEIDQYLFQNEFGSAYRKDVSQIIDKYKAEGDDKEENADSD